MKIRMFILFLVILVTLPAAACTSTSEETLRFDIDDFMNQSTISMNSKVGVGDVIRVVLGSNPSTGYNWGTPDISDGTVIEVAGESEYIPPDEELPGAAGFEEFKFKAREKGTSTVELEYSQPWEGGEKGTWKFTLSVTVE